MWKVSIAYLFLSLVCFAKATEPNLVSPWLLSGIAPEAYIGNQSISEPEFRKQDIDDFFRDETTTLPRQSEDFPLPLEVLDASPAIESSSIYRPISAEGISQFRRWLSPYTTHSGAPNYQSAYQRYYSQLYSNYYNHNLRAAEQNSYYRNSGLYARSQGGSHLPTSFYGSVGIPLHGPEFRYIGGTLPSGIYARQPVGSTILPINTGVLYPNFGPAYPAAENKGGMWENWKTDYTGQPQDATTNDALLGISNQERGEGSTAEVIQSGDPTLSLADIIQLRQEINSANLTPSQSVKLVRSKYPAASQAFVTELLASFGIEAPVSAFAADEASAGTPTEMPAEESNENSENEAANDNTLDNLDDFFTNTPDSQTTELTQGDLVLPGIGELENLDSADQKVIEQLIRYFAANKTQQQKRTLRGSWPRTPKIA